MKVKGTGLLLAGVGVATLLATAIGSAQAPAAPAAGQAAGGRAGGGGARGGGGRPAAALRLRCSRALTSTTTVR
jgi:hypothetical protein